MIRFISISFFILLSLISVGQNYYDFENSRKFGDYLFNTGQFELASQEYERALFLQKNDSSTALRLMQSYRKMGSMARALKTYRNFDEKSSYETMEPLFADEYMKILIEQGSYAEGMNLLGVNNRLKQKHRYQLGLLLLQNKRPDAGKYIEKYPKNTINDHLYHQLAELASNATRERYRKPWVGSFLSALIPGSGKVYAGYWKDGIIGLLFCASTGYVAYKAFDKYGTQSAYSWIMGGLAVGYYAGNIYGGQKAVKHFNHHLDLQLKNATEGILYTDF